MDVLFYIAVATLNKSTEAVQVSLSVKAPDHPKLCIDGALRAKLYTSEGECAGCAYLVLPKGGVCGRTCNISGICINPVVSDSYTAKIEPVDLWELASKGCAVGTNKDRLTKAEHRKIVAGYKEAFKEECRCTIANIRKKRQKKGAKTKKRTALILTPIRQRRDVAPINTKG